MERQTDYTVKMFREFLINGGKKPGLGPGLEG
jgi:hypothetical protein